MTIEFRQASYTASVRRWLRHTDHYLHNPPPSCLLCVVALQDTWTLAGICLLGRPISRMLPQDGTWAEITRMYLIPGLPHGTASAMIRFAFERAHKRGVKTVISYHDRTRHTGCIYRKAGMRKDGVTKPSGKGWGSRTGRAETQRTPKRRWRIDL